VIRSERIAKREALVPEFEAAVRAAVWEQIEKTDPVLLAADDGTPYGVPAAASDSFGRRSELERMADAAAREAGKVLRNWL
jgi:hypothetical protein